MYCIKPNPIKRNKCVSITTCLIVAIFTLILTSCSVPQTVRYSKTVAKAPKVKNDKNKDNSKLEDELYFSETSKEATEKSIENFEKLLLSSKEAQNNTTDGVTGGEPNKAPQKKRIPTLREQMTALNSEQQTMRNDLANIKSDINDIRSSVNEIKTAVYGINDIVTGKVEKPKNTTKVKKTSIAKAKTPTKRNHPKMVKTNILLPNEKAEKMVKKDVKSDFTLGEEYYNNKNYQKATTYLTKVIRKDRNSAIAGKAHYYLGKMNYEQKSYNQAIAHLKKALTIKGSGYKDDSQALLAEAYIRSGNNPLAKEAYKSLITEYPTSKFVPKARKMLQQL